MLKRFSIVTVILWIIGWTVAYFVILPPINPMALSFWFFFGPAVIIPLVILIQSAALKNGFNKGKSLWPVMIVLLAVGVFFGGMVLTSPVFNSSGFANRISVVTSSFEEDIKPVDFEMIDRIAAGHRYLVTLEENVLRGGYGEQVLAYVESRYPDLRVICVTLPDAYVEHGNVTLLRSVLGIDSDSIMKQLCEEIPCLREKASAEEEAE